jgi:hypothetical protein
MPNHSSRSSRAIFPGVAAWLGVAAAAWPAPAQAPRDDPSAARKADRPDSRTAPGQPGAAPARSKDGPAGAPVGKLPPGAQVLLERRRTEVREREAAWAAKRREVEQHLADILAHARQETLRAKAEYQNKMLTREVAEIGVREYEEGIFVQERGTLEGEIALAKSEVVRVQDHLASTRQAFEQGNVSKAHLVADELNVEKAKFDLQQAESRLEILEKYGKHKALSELKAAVAKAQSEELMKQAAWELAKRREDELAARSKQFGSRLTETHIAALLDEAASRQAKVVQLLTRAQESGKTEGLAPEEARRRAEAVQKAIVEARSHEDAARAKLTEALALSRLVQSWREDLRETEAGLRKAREDLERLEKLMREH